MMLRFYTPLIEKVLCVLLQAQDAGLEVDSAQRYVGKSSRLNCSKNLTYHLQRSRNLKSEDVSLRQLVDTLGEAVMAANRDGSDVDLIDTIVRVLQLPYSKNVLSGGTLELLRSAILLPKEVASLKTRLDKGELSCFHCGKDLVSGELTVLTTDGRRGNGILCLRCAGSSILIPCQGCDHHMGLMAKIYKFLKGAECDTCKAKGGKAVKPKEVDSDEFMPDTPGIPGHQVPAFSDFVMSGGIFDPPAPAATPVAEPRTFAQRFAAQTGTATQRAVQAEQTRAGLWDELSRSLVTSNWQMPNGSSITFGDTTGAAGTPATPADPTPPTGGTNETE